MPQAVPQVVCFLFLSSILVSDDQLKVQFLLLCILILEKADWRETLQKLLNSLFKKNPIFVQADLLQILFIFMWLGFFQWSPNASLYFNHSFLLAYPSAIYLPNYLLFPLFYFLWMLGFICHFFSPSQKFLYSFLTSWIIWLLFNFSVLHTWGVCVWCKMKSLQMCRMQYPKWNPTSCFLYTLLCQLEFPFLVTLILMLFTLK